MKIAILHTALGRFGGAERLCVLHAVHMKREGYDIDLYYHGEIPRTWKKLLEENNLRVFDLPVSIRNLSLNTRGLANIIASLKQYDLILLHHHVDTILKYLLTKIYGRKTIWYCGEPLRAIWEKYVSGYDYTINKRSSVITSAKIYGELFSRILERNYKLVVETAKLMDLVSVKRIKQIVSNSFFHKKGN